jgi:hypothetical protein
MQPNANNLRGRRSRRPVIGRRDGREEPQARGTAIGPRDHRACCFASGGYLEQRPVAWSRCAIASIGYDRRRSRRFLEQGTR